MGDGSEKEKVVPKVRWKLHSLSSWGFEGGQKVRASERTGGERRGCKEDLLV